MSDRICSTSEISVLIQPLLNRSVSRAWKGYGSAIFLELGALNPASNQSEVSIGVEWDWRIECDRTVLCGSSNRGSEIQQQIQGLEGATVQAIALLEPIPDLAVQFSNGWTLRSQVMMNADPQWSLQLADHQWIYPKNGAIWIGAGRTTLTDEEQTTMAIAEQTAKRWGQPTSEPILGQCKTCQWFQPLEGEGHLFDYGVCLNAKSPLDGHAVHRCSGCPHASDPF